MGEWVKRHSFLEMKLTNFGCRLAQSEGYMQFSKAPIAANFGDLQRGEIPEPLKFNRPFRKSSSGGALPDARNSARLGVLCPILTIYYNLLY